MSVRPREGQLLSVYEDWTMDEKAECYYVGRGVEKRLKNPRRNNLHKHVREHRGLDRRIVFTTYDNDIANRKEVEVIAARHTYLHDPEYNGVGTNFTIGGDTSMGWHPSEETKRKIGKANTGKQRTDEHRDNLRQGQIHRYEDPEERRKTSEKGIAVWADPVYHAENALKRRGEGNGRAVITEADVVNIRTEWDNYDASKRGATKAFTNRWADHFGVTSENIFGIIKRKSWRHI